MPIVYLVGQNETSFVARANSAGVTWADAPRQNLAHALRLLPDAKLLVIVAGATQSDRLRSARTIEIAREFDPALGIVDLTGLPIDKTRESVATAPSFCC